MKAVVIGSGIAGIATSIRLARKGYQVIVCEANAYPGGKLTAFDQEGFRFDAGPSLFTLPELVDDLFRLCGRTPESAFRYRTLDIACKYFWEDGTRLTAYTDPDRFAQEVEDKLQVPASRVHDYLQHVSSLYRYNANLFMKRSLHRWSTYFSADVARALFRVHTFNLTRSMHAVNEERLQEPHLVQLFDRMATYNGSSPYLAPGVLNIIAHLEHNGGTYLPEGGMHAITTSLVELAREQGVDFRLNTPVKSIDTQGKRVLGVSTESGAISADLVVSNMDVVPTYRKLLPNEPAPEKRLKQERSSSAVIFYWGINRSFPELDLHSIFFSDDYQEEFRHLFESKTLYHDPTVYVNITSKYEPGDAPEGQENWFVMVNAPANHGQDWDALIAQARESVVTKLSRILGVSLQDHIVCESILEPRILEARTSSFRGALYGSSSNNRFSAFLRHPNFSQRLKGLYFCGGSVHPGGGIPLCLLSAQIVDGLVPAP
ncbi:MAG: phytoene desaturase [Leptolyngbya sp. SIO3F4]|nr:phytoene desaturase [Leptolyngbya sp. SIO3F4]